jgi:hypothetical protein
MDHFDLQHNCEGGAATLDVHSACVEVAGLGWGGIVIALAILVALAGLGWLLWRRMRSRLE